MLFDRLKRDSTNYLNDWVELPDNSIFTKGGCKIYFPSGWTECLLAQVSDEITAVGFVAVVHGDQFVTLSACSMLRFTPSVINFVRFGEEEYYEFLFDPGTTVIPNVHCVIDDTMSYKVYKRFTEMGKIPVYMDAIDIHGYLDSTKHFCGTEIGATESVLSAISSSTLKDPNDYSRGISFVLKGPVPKGYRNFKVIPLRDVQYGASNTVAKLMGSYADIAINSALVNPSTRREEFEDLIRS